ncbi:MAG: hypothetical protein LBJ78_01805 [Puniceicoccales bacterium]|nr:hypothetical protein [Puniceicoccales bacterium]
MFRTVVVIVFFLPYCAHCELFRLQADAPIYGFKMPMFNKRGEKIWQCLGERVQYISEAKIKIEQMCIEWYLPENVNTIDMVIRSPKATVSLTQHRADGRSLLTITNPGYTILGNDWTWEEKQQNKSFAKVIIRKNAHVTFYDNFKP